MDSNQLPGCGLNDEQRRQYDKEMRARMIAEGIIKPYVDSGCSIQHWCDKPTLRGK